MKLDDIKNKTQVVFELIGANVLGLMSFVAAKESGDHSSITVNEGSQSDIEGLFRSIFAKRLFQYLLALFVVFSFIFLLECLYFAIPKQVYGLVLDLFGAAIVARGLFRGAEEIRAIANDVSISGYSASFLGMTAEFEGTASPKAIEVGSTVDGVIGTFLLTLGFTVQIWAITF